MFICFGRRPLFPHCMWGFILTSLVACGDSPQVEETRSSGPRPVKIITLSEVGITPDIRYPAIIDAADRAEIGFQVSGLIEELPVNQANTVEKGDVIAKLNDRNLKSELNSATAAFNKDEKEYQRAARLVNKGAISKSDLDKRKSQRDISRAQLETAQKALDDSVLVAPFAGVIASLPVSRLQNVNAGETIANLINLSELDATINLPASVMALIPSKEERTASVLLESNPESVIEAVFSEANLVADSATQTYAVTFSFKPPENRLVLPGMNATVVIHASSSSPDSENSVAVPMTAIQSDGGGQYVWRYDPTSMKVSRQVINIVPGVGDAMVVSDGLVPGDQIVGAGGAYLSEGLQVTPWTE